MAAARNRRSQSKPAGAPLWMVTFADMMTLLLTFFVLLLSFVVIDQIKYQTLAEYIKAGFTASVMEQMAGRVGEIPLADEMTGSLIPLIPIAPDEAVQARTQVDESRERSPAELLESLLSEQLEREIDMGDVVVDRIENEIVIRLQDRFAFELGSEKVQPEFMPILMRIKDILAEVRAQFVVSGHTDNLPIATERFRSNWELSAARAASVVHELTADGSIRAETIRVEGHSDARPVATNDTPEGRARNRRVEIRVSPHAIMEHPDDAPVIDASDLLELPR